MVQKITKQYLNLKFWESFLRFFKIEKNYLGRFVLMLTIYKTFRFSKGQSLKLKIDWYIKNSNKFNHQNKIKVK